MFSFVILFLFLKIVTTGVKSVADPQRKIADADPVKNLSADPDADPDPDS
jgi:hypothetical protein